MTFPRWFPNTGGLSAAEHAAIADLIHFIDDGPANGFASGALCETTYAGALPTESVWYADATKTKRIVAVNTTYAGALPTTQTWRMYDDDGALLVTLTDSITYNGALEVARARTWV